MKLQKLNQSHIDYVKPRSISGGDFKVPQEYEWDFALVDEDITLGIGGIGLLTLTTGFCWLDLAEDARFKIPTVYRLLIEFMNKLTETHGIRRLECFVDCSFPEGVHLVKHLGFEEECKCANVFGDKPGFRYVKFFGKDGK